MQTYHHVTKPPNFSEDYIRIHLWQLVKMTSKVEIKMKMDYIQEIKLDKRTWIFLHILFLLTKKK